MGNRKRRSWIRRARHWVVYGGARAAAGILGALPYDLAIAIGRGLGSLGFYLARRNRRRAFEHLDLAYGGRLSSAEKRRVVRGMFANLGIVAAEMVRLPRLTGDDMRRRIRFVNEDRLRVVLEEAKRGGVILITAHLGAWEWIAQYPALALRAGLVVVAREQSNPLLQAWSERLRRAHGVEVIYRKRAGIAAVRALREGKMLGVLLDQCTKGEGVFVPFFGRPAHTLTGPARLAIRTGAAVVPVFAIREEGGRRIAVHVLPPVPLPEGKDPAQSAYQLTACLTSIIEEQVRRWPEQWVWLHRRWKRTPETDRDPVFEGVPPRNEGI